MSSEKYNTDNDIYANWEMNRDFKKMYIQNQNIAPNPYVRHYLHPIAVKEERNKQLVEGLGLKKVGFWVTSLGFLYLGGLFHARKQFINGGDYFLNAKFDFVGGKKSILFGLVFGVSAGAFLFGNKFLLNDYIVSRVNSLFKVPREKGPNDLILKETTIRMHDTPYDR